jgi:hypothetical protein
LCRIPKPSFEELKKYFDTITTLNIFHVHLIDASNIHYYFFQIVKDRQPIAQLLEPRIALTGSIANAQGSGHSEHWALGIGGGRRDRTDDPLLAKQVLSQLSYAPRHRLTSASRAACWWVWMDSNHRPPPYQDGALTD